MRKIRKNDIIMIAFLLLICVVIQFYNVYKRNSGNENSRVIISAFGKEYKNLPLNENNEIIIENGNMKNIIVIENGEVYMKDANCDEGLCLRQDKISRPGESIVCLPNKVKVSITGNKEENDIDAYSK